MTINRRSLMASAVAAATPAAFTGLGASLFSQSSMAQMENTDIFTSYDSEKMDKILKLTWTENQSAPFGAKYVGWTSAMVPIDFVQFYRRPINNGKGFDAKVSHWQAEYRNGKKYRKEKVLLEISFNADDSGNLVTFYSPDGNTNNLLYTDIRNSGDADSADVRNFNCTSLTYNDPNHRSLWSPPLAPITYPLLNFNDQQLTISDNINIPGYLRTTFWAYEKNAQTGAHTYGQYHRVSILLPTGIVNEPYRWFSRVVKSSDPWVDGTLLQAETDLRQYAAVSWARWGLIAPIFKTGRDIRRLGQQYAAQRLTPGLLIVSAGNCIANFFMYISCNTTLWGAYASASTSGDRIAAIFTLVDVIIGHNKLVDRLYTGPNSIRIDSSLLFDNTAVVAGSYPSTNMLWTYGSPINNNPVADNSACVVYPVNTL